LIGHLSTGKSRTDFAAAEHVSRSKRIDEEKAVMLRIRTLGAMGAGLFALVAGTGVAVAADLYQSPPSSAAPDYAPTSAYAWSGPYVGLQGGYGWGSSDVDGLVVPLNGWQGGAFAGYNFQPSGALVLGIEGDINASGKKGTSAGTTVSNTWNGSIRGRVGVAVDRFMVYGAGGVAFGNIKAVTGPTTESASKVGWTAALGVQAAVMENVHARLEVRHTNLGTAALPTHGPTTYYSNDLMLGVGFGF
jgi:outer membrane immunogenic protein